MRRRFFTLNVFTAERFTGNPLAVVIESDGLDAATMQAIAREFGHPETVFAFNPDDPAQRARLRIFTPARELPFAGHPTVGTAVLLAHLDGGTTRRELVLLEGVGPVACTVEPDGQGGTARFVIPRRPERLGAVRDLGKLAAALGLSPADFDIDGFAPEHWTAGNAFTFAPLHGLAAMYRAKPDSAAWNAAFGPSDPLGVFLFCREVEEAGHDFHARMFAPLAGVAEDPATGSAAAAFAGVIAASAGLADGEHAFVIEQGYEMGRPSQIGLWLTMRDGAFAAASVGGPAVIVTEGTIEA
jgi:trans-2,3-dihydro-3-hydroxyanthranilate isomerase